jgi:hypothetical protein
VAVCLEPSKGRLIYALLKYDYLVLYPIHPRMLAKFREALAPAARRMIPRRPSSDANWSVNIRRNWSRGGRPMSPPGRANVSSSIAGLWCIIKPA